MIRQACSAVCSFLTLYPKNICAIPRKGESATKAKEKGVMEEVQPNAESSNVGNDTCVSELAKSNGDVKLVSTEETLQKFSQSARPSKICLLGLDIGTEAPVSAKNKAMFLGKSWRNALCQCDMCLTAYNQKHIGFLVDKDDSIAEYEKVAKEKREEKLQQQEGVELDFLNNLGHVEKMEILTGIADMKNEMLSFFESYDPSKPITSDDVHQVFENLAKKRRREL